MNDIVISACRIRREGLFAAAAFIVAFAANIYAVIHFERPWIEILSQLGYVVVMAAMIYILLWIPRLLVALVLRILRRRR